MEMTLNIHVTGLESLADALSALVNKTPPSASTAPMQVPAPTTAPATTKAPSPVSTAFVPVSPGPAVPVAAPSYTLDQIAKAGAALVDAGKLAPLQALLARYGVTAVTQIPPEQYGAFATELRTLGAQI